MLSRSICPHVYLRSEALWLKVEYSTSLQQLTSFFSDIQSCHSNPIDRVRRKQTFSFDMPKYNAESSSQNKDKAKDMPQTPIKLNQRDSVALPAQISVDAEAKEIQRLLDIDSKILYKHFNEANHAGPLTAKDFTRRRVLKESVEFRKWLYEEASNILFVNGNDPKYKGEKYPIFSSALIERSLDFREAYSTEPIYCFAGAHADFEGNGSCASILLRSMCWQMLDRY